MHRARIQISLCICAVRSESSLGAFWKKSVKSKRILTLQRAVDKLKLVNMYPDELQLNQKEAPFLVYRYLMAGLSVSNDIIST